LELVKGPKNGSFSTGIVQMVGSLHDLVMGKTGTEGRIWADSGTAPPLKIG
jgi:hypothetical protein